MKKTIPLLACVAIVAVAIGPWLLGWSSLPDPMASHWDVHGHANGHLAPMTLLLALGGVATLLAVCAAVSIRHDSKLPGSVTAGPGLAFVGGVLAVTSLGSVVANHNAASWETAHLSPAWIVLAVAFAAVTASATALAQTSAAGVARNTADRTVTVGPTERIAWVGRASARWLLGLAAAVVVVGVVQAIILSPLTGAIVVVAGVAVASFSSLLVIASPHGVRVRGVLGWPRVTLPLDRIGSAEAIEVQPMQWGGWGYRGSLRLFRRAAWIVRRGGGLKLNLRDGKIFIVTVDDADEAAAVLNGLLAT
jgi:hypothetical protein